MVVAMRLMRMGTTHNPVYRISVGDSRKVPTAKFIEHIGTYNPRPDKMGHKQVRKETRESNGEKEARNAQHEQTATHRAARSPSASPALCPLPSFASSCV